MKRFIVFSLSLLMVMGVAGAASAAPVLTFDLAPGTDSLIDPLGSITLDIFAVVEDDTDSSITYELQSFGFDLEYDAALLNVTGASVDAAWNFFPSADFGTDGLVSMSGSVLLAGGVGIGSPALLGSITFAGEGLDGITDLTIFDGDRGGAFADFALTIATGGGASLDDQISGGVVIGTIATPIPGSILLLGSGLIGLIGLARRKRS